MYLISDVPFANINNSDRIYYYPNNPSFTFTLDMQRITCISIHKHTLRVGDKIMVRMDTLDGIVTLTYDPFSEVRHIDNLFFDSDYHLSEPIVIHLSKFDEVGEKPLYINSLELTIDLSGRVSYPFNKNIRLDYLSGVYLQDVKLHAGIILNDTKTSPDYTMGYKDNNLYEEGFYGQLTTVVQKGFYKEMTATLQSLSLDEKILLEGIYRNHSMKPYICFSVLCKEGFPSYLHTVVGRITEPLSFSLENYNTYKTQIKIQSTDAIS